MPLGKYLGIPKQEEEHTWEYSDGKATLVFFPSGGHGTSLLHPARLNTVPPLDRASEPVFPY